MTDIFISYSHKDRTFANWLAEALKSEKLDVWWDRELAPGRKFRPEIQRKLDAARCIVVIWSKTSAASEFVWAEANAGLNRNRLVPVFIEDVELPPPFGEFQTVDLTNWHGDRADINYQSVLTAVREVLANEIEDREGPFPDPDQQRFTVAVARIDQDIGDQLQDLIATDLAAYEGIYAVKLSRSIAVSGSVPEKSIASAQNRAHAYLEEMNAAVIIWGKIIRFAGQAVPELYLTISHGRQRPSGRYLPNHELRLPRVFWSDLSDILCMIVVSYDAEFRRLEGQYLGDRLQPFVTRTERLLNAATDERGWSIESRGLTRILLGDAQMLIGSQGGDRSILERAIATFEMALIELPQLDSPRDWARAQNGLAISCWLLGDRDGDRSLLNRAVEACKSALEIRDAERDPIDWAQTYNDLGNALVTIGKRTPEIAHLQRAVAAYKTALSKRTIDASPLDWAQTSNNLGLALWHLAQRTGSKELLFEALTTLTASLEIYTQEKTPLDWSQTKNNLGLVLWALGENSGELEYFHQAITTYRESLRERRRQQVPLLWAQTQNNLGLVLWSLGERTDDIKLLRQAGRVFRLALRERTREQSATEWAETKNNLGAVLWSIGQYMEGTKELQQAVHAYNDALSAYSNRTDLAMDVSRTQRNLGNALAALGRREHDLSQIEAGLAHLFASISIYDPKQEQSLWAEIKCDIGFAMLAIGEDWRDLNYLDQAEKAFNEAAGTYRTAGMSRHAHVFEGQATFAGRLRHQVERQSR